MGDETVKFVNELHIILRGISTQDAGEETFVLGIIQDCFSAWGVVCWASDGSPSILPRLASSSRDQACHWAKKKSVTLFLEIHNVSQLGVWGAL